MKWFTGFTFAAAAVSLCAAGPLEDLKPGEWYEAPNSHLESVKPNPLPDGYFSGIIDAWSGGAFDTKRDRFIIWGGGHTDYAGNEAYAFDVNTLKWIRCSEPSANTGGDECSGIYPDGKPRARHTYGSIQYVPAIDRFCGFGAGGFYPGGQCGNSRFDAFDFTAVAWERMPNMPNGSYGTGQFTAVDPVTGNAWSHGCLSGSILAEFVSGTKSWKLHGDQSTEDYLDYYLTAEIDPVRRVMVAVGGGEVWQWDISLSGAIKGAKVTTTGATEIASRNSPGLAWDAASGQLVAWNGGPDVYTLNTGTKIWAKVPPAPTNGVTPTSANSNGTFGRFRYIPSKNLFVAVNRVNENVYFYRLAGGPGAARPRQLLSANRAAGGPGTLFDIRGRKVASFENYGLGSPGRLDEPGKLSRGIYPFRTAGGSGGIRVVLFKEWR